METEKLNINFADGENVKELIIRETTSTNRCLSSNHWSLIS